MSIKPIRVEFILSMPGVNTWNGRWSGEAKRYAIVRTVEHELITLCPHLSWGYNFGDGWYASVAGRIMNSGERAKKSDGFCGYDWMVDSIIRYGSILNEQQAHARALSKVLDEVNQPITTNI